MNAAEKNARRNGYTFQGAYSSRDKESMKQCAAELRKQGNKAIVVPAECGGHSVYWIESEANKELRMREHAASKRNQLLAERAKLEARLSEIANELVNLTQF